MSGSVPMGRIFGVPLRTHWSAPVLVVLLSSSLSGRTLPAWAPGRSATTYTMAGLAGALLLILSLLLHEAAHAVTARRAGIQVEDVTLWGLGGVTRMGRAKTPRIHLRVSVIGPLTSLALGGLALAAGSGMHNTLHWALPAAVLLWTGWANILLGLFNLLPAAPLDGGRVLQALLWWRWGDRERAERIAGRSGQVTGALLVAAGWVELSYGVGSGLWLALVGLFVSISGLAEVRRATLETAMRGVSVGEAMSSPVVTGADWLTVDRFLEQILRNSHHSAIPLLDFEGRPSGIVELRRLSTVPAARRAELRAREMAVPIARCCVASPADSLVEVVERAGMMVPFRILVMDAGRLTGIVTGHDISRIVRQRRPTPGPSRVNRYRAPSASGSDRGR